MTLYATSDWHIGHRLVAGLRGFTNTDDHDNTILANLRAVLTKHDRLKVLGNSDTDGDASRDGAASTTCRLNTAGYRSVSMPDIPAVPTVDLLTRAANAAGKAAAEAECDETTSWRHFASVIGKVFQRHPSAHLIAASGPDHWRAVEALLRAAIEAHGPDHAGRCVSAGGRPLGGQGLLAAIDRSGVCMWVQSLRPLAEQVLQHLGDTP